MRADPVAACAAIPGGDPLISAKLRVAEIRSRVVPRQRLLDRLREGTRGPLTLLSAPAGSGKTVLAGSWVGAGQAPGKVTWISLESGDDQPGVFWAYVVEGLARSGVQVRPVDPPTRAVATGRSLLARLSAGLSERAEPSVLVLDNVDVLGRGQVVDDIDFLIRHSTPQLRVVAISRTDPPLPLHRYRLAGWLTEIHFDELAFTTSEAQAMLTEHGVRQRPDDVELLVQRTEGWAAGLRLAAMSLQDRDEREGARIVRRFAGDRRDVAEYFLAEILDGQPPDMREFLVRTSVVDHLRPGLADELSGRDDSARLLPDLARANAFVLSADDGCFRYHLLFRDLLRSQLDGLPIDDVVRLHRGAAQWLVANGQVLAAVGHAAAAGDWDHAALLVIENIRVGSILTGSDPPWAKVFARMPSDVDSPHASALSAALALAAGDTDKCAALLDSRPEADTRAVRLTTAAVEALLAGNDADAAAAAVARFGEVAAEGEPPPSDLCAAVRASAGAALMLAGRLDSAEDMLVAAARSADTVALARLKVRVLGQLALLNAVQGRLRQAGKFAHAAAKLAEKCGLTGPDRPSAVDAALAWIHAEEYDLTTARRHIRSRTAQDDPVAAAALSVLRDRLLRKCEDTETVPWLNGQRHTNGAAGTPIAQVQAWLCRASQDLDRGRTELARQALGHALQSAAPENLRRPIIEAPTRLRRLLAQDKELLHRHRWLGSALVGVPTIDPVDRNGPATLVEPLTDREREVLNNMAALLSTEEIARTMFVSVNTVKTHIRGILRKLSASRRNDAIRRARELGLLNG